MLKKSLVVMSVSAAFFVQAQDISVVRNSIDVCNFQYANGGFF